jgi:hypothetical protein
MKTARCTPKYTIVKIISHRVITLDIRFLQARESLSTVSLVARIRIAVEGARLTLPSRDCEEWIRLDAHDVDVYLFALLIPIAMDTQVSNGFRCTRVDLFPFRHTRRETNLCVVVLNDWHNTPRSVA